MEGWRAGGVRREEGSRRRSDTMPLGRRGDGDEGKEGTQGERRRCETKRRLPLLEQSTTNLPQLGHLIHWKPHRLGAESQLCFLGGEERFDARASRFFSAVSLPSCSLLPLTSQMLIITRTIDTPL